MLARQRCLPYRVRKTTNTFQPPPTGRPGYTDLFAADPPDRLAFALARREGPVRDPATTNQATSELFTAVVIE